LATQQLRDGVVDSALDYRSRKDQIVACSSSSGNCSTWYCLWKSMWPKATVDDAAIRDYFEANKERFVNPEQVRIAICRIEALEIAEGITLSENELKASYEEQIAKYGRPEERSASHILVKLPLMPVRHRREQARAKAQQMADRSVPVLRASIRC
jgi:peptidyl-prolyl cis-trans isomerase D